jgi:hypothetical protein
MLSAEGPITLERVTLDGTKIKANAGGNTFRRNAHCRVRQSASGSETGSLKRKL